MRSKAMNMHRFSTVPASAAANIVTRARVGRLPNLTRRVVPRRTRQPTEVARARNPHIARRARNAVGSIPASYANRDSGPNIPNRDADTMTIAMPRNGIAPSAPAATGRADVRGALDIGAWEGGRSGCADRPL